MTATDGLEPSDHPDITIYLDASEFPDPPEAPAVDEPDLVEAPATSRSESDLLETESLEAYPNDEAALEAEPSKHSEVTETTPKTTCKHCSAAYPSRNQLFKHLPHCHKQKAHQENMRPVEALQQVQESLQRLDKGIAHQFAELAAKMEQQRLDGLQVEQRLDRLLRQQRPLATTTPAKEPQLAQLSERQDQHLRHIEAMSNKEEDTIAKKLAEKQAARRDHGDVVKGRRQYAVETYSRPGEYKGTFPPESQSWWLSEDRKKHARNAKKERIKLIADDYRRLRPVQPRRNWLDWHKQDVGVLRADEGDVHSANNIKPDCV